MWSVNTTYFLNTNGLELYNYSPPLLFHFSLTHTHTLSPLYFTSILLPLSPYLAFSKLSHSPYLYLPISLSLPLSHSLSLSFSLTDSLSLSLYLSISLPPLSLSISLSLFISLSLSLSPTSLLPLSLPPFSLFFLLSRVWLQTYPHCHICVQYPSI